MFLFLLELLLSLSLLLLSLLLLLNGIRYPSRRSFDQSNIIALTPYRMAPFRQRRFRTRRRVIDFRQPERRRFLHGLQKIVPREVHVQITLRFAVVAPAVIAPAVIAPRLARSKAGRVGRQRRQRHGGVRSSQIAPQRKFPRLHRPERRRAAGAGMRYRRFLRRLAMVGWRRGEERLRCRHGFLHGIGCGLFGVFVTASRSIPRKEPRAAVAAFFAAVGDAAGVEWSGVAVVVGRGASIMTAFVIVHRV
mmetsp:Transcript_23024/g.48548  ORF Transcript_23024/g.48548 Transcript_23024/m.48548 type:complete len:249 (-) Transcript_23024:196-942(-)